MVTLGTHPIFAPPEYHKHEAQLSIKNNPRPGTANIHTVGHRHPPPHGFEYDWHYLQRHYPTKTRLYKPYIPYQPTGRTILHYGCTAFSFKWRDNVPYFFTMKDPPETPKKP